MDEEEAGTPSRDEDGKGSREREEEARMVVMGKDGTGKSALIVRLLTRRFIHEYDPTSEDVYAFETLIDGKKALMKIMDTAGLVERTAHRRERQIEWGDGFLLVLSSTSRESLRDAIRIKEMIDRLPENRKKPLALVANKRDLVHAREVTSAELRELAGGWRCRVFETSATDDYGSVSEPFFALYRDILRDRERRGLFPRCCPSEGEIALSDVDKRYRNRLSTR
ncbi:ras-related and estrogen-regulated growth inhibitor-like [Centruroides vittatus]|uniref:ras-related and estrogen-regulated growth inhibitor-like n=1 Tax=Centruroides vittatus TaxID=120091 RepID=UPI00351095D5